LGALAKNVRVGFVVKASIGFKAPTKKLARLWVERNDAEAYLVLSDPSVRLREEKIKSGP
jgi:hypothetical protein